MPPPMIRSPWLRIQPSSSRVETPIATSSLDRAGGQAVAADLLAGERRLLQHQDVEPGAGEVVGRGGSGRTCTDDDDVGVALDHVHLPDRL